MIFPRDMAESPLFPLSRSKKPGTRRLRISTGEAYQQLMHSAIWVRGRKIQ